MLFSSLVLLTLRGALSAPCLSSSPSHWEQSRDIDACGGSNAPTCCHESTCWNLSFAFKNYLSQNSTRFCLSNGTHYFSDVSANFSSVENIAIIGRGSHPGDVVIECVGNAGLYFFKAADIEIEDVTFRGCAAMRNSTSFELASNTPLQFQVALFFRLCTNITMQSVVVSDSPNATGVVMYDTFGENNFIDCIFSNNGGGGFHIEFTYCAQDEQEEHCNAQKQFRAYSTVYSFVNCEFSSNVVVSMNEPFTYVPQGNRHNVFGTGGGIAVYFKGSVSDVHCLLSNCTFKNNSANAGSGLIVEFHDSSEGNNFTVLNSDFIGNCHSNHPGQSKGGGMSVGHFVFEQVSARAAGDNKVHIKDSMFSENIASNGGALYAALTPLNSDVALVTVYNCSFTGNQAHLGAAVEVFLLLTDHVGLIPHVEIQESKFVKNSVITGQNKLSWQLGIGIFYSYKIPVYFSRETIFKFNNGSALGLIGTYAKFVNSSASFESNVSFRGGAVALFGGSSILFDAACTFRFVRNKATVKGGAIYSKHSGTADLEVHQLCFIRHVNLSLSSEYWDATFHFDSNTAGISGNSIYSSSISSCSRSSNGTVSSRTIFCSGNWVYVNGSNCTGEIFSDAKKITAVNTSIEFIPGKPFALLLDVTDELDHNITDHSVFSATVINDDDDISVDPDYTYISGGRANILGKDNNLNTSRLILGYTGDREWHITLEVKALSCPPGFTHSISNSSKCECERVIFQGKVWCNPETFKSYLLPGYWIGEHPEYQDKTLAASLCLPGFCGVEYPIGINSISELDELICGHIYRTGTLCGKCMDGYGLAVNSRTYRCVQCGSAISSANVIYYILTIYIPLFVLFILIIFLNIRLTTGPANAFLVYSQAVTGTFDLTAQGHIALHTVSHSSLILQMYRVPYGIFYLEFFENFLPPLCLGTRLSNALDVLQLDYIVAIFPLLMIIAVVVFTKVIECCHLRLPRRIKALQLTKVRESLVHSFAAFLLLSYTKFGITTAHIVNSIALFGRDGQFLGNRRVRYAGHYAFNDHYYVLRYLLPSVFIFMVFVAVPPLLLLEYPLRLLEKVINKSNLLKKVYPVGKVQILLDTFQGCFKPKMRCFAGIYFLFRLVIYLGYVITDTWLGQLVMQQIAVTIMIVLIALLQPYTKWYQNCIDLLIFTNLGILNALSMYLNETSIQNPKERLKKFPFIVLYILIFLPLIYMVVYVFVYLLRKRCHIRFVLSTEWPFIKKHSSAVEDDSEYRSLEKLTQDNHTRSVVSFSHRWSSTVPSDLSRQWSLSLNGPNGERDVDAQLFKRAQSRNRYTRYNPPKHVPTANIHSTGAEALLEESKNDVELTQSLSCT